MSCSLLQLTDLPDELLMSIFMELGNVPAIISFTNINERFDRILTESVFTNSLTLMNCASNKDHIQSLPVALLDRFCSHTLPAIHDKIQWLNVESSSMERILLAADYPNLYRLGFFGIDNQSAEYFFDDHVVFSRMMTHRISHLSLTFGNGETKHLTDDLVIALYIQIFVVFTNLQYFNYQSSPHLIDPRLSFAGGRPISTCPTLLELRVSLRSLSDCLHILDGRFGQLRALHVTISVISSTYINTTTLPTLQHFSLTCTSPTSFYDRTVPPLLHRMVNLKSLALHLTLTDMNRFLDGNELQQNIVDHLPRLQTLHFNVRSIIDLQPTIAIPTDQDVLDTFVGFSRTPVTASVDRFPKRKSAQCHIYSHPYTSACYHDITNRFPGGTFRSVREISLLDEQPFEDEFFHRLARAFPLIRKLSVSNRKPQKQKPPNQLPVIEYRHLTELELLGVHKDYVEMFLDHSRVHLSNEILLRVDYRPLRQATYDFKRDALRTNAAQVHRLSMYDYFRQSRHFRNYFPRVHKFSLPSDFYSLVCIE